MPCHPSHSEAIGLNEVEDLIFNLVECLIIVFQALFKLLVLWLPDEGLGVPLSVVGLKGNARHPLLQDVVVAVDHVLIRLPGVIVNACEGEWNEAADEPKHVVPFDELRIETEGTTKAEHASQSGMATVELGWSASLVGHG